MAPRYNYVHFQHLCTAAFGKFDIELDRRLAIGGRSHHAKLVDSERNDQLFELGILPQKHQKIFDLIKTWQKGKAASKAGPRS